MPDASEFPRLLLTDVCTAIMVYVNNTLVVRTNYYIRSLIKFVRIIMNFNKLFNLLTDLFYYVNVI